MENTKLFDEVKPQLPSDWLVKSLAVARTLPASNEKAKSERFISPILMDVYNSHKTKLTLFSGEELNIEPENDLSGACAFFFPKNLMPFF